MSGTSDEIQPPKDYPVENSERPLKEVPVGLMSEGNKSGVSISPEELRHIHPDYHTGGASGFLNEVRPAPAPKVNEVSEAELKDRVRILEDEQRAARGSC